MNFPVYVALGPLRLHPHVVFEAIAYAVGLYISLFRRLRRSPVAGDITPAERSSISVGALAGALLGAKLLVLLQHWDLLGQDWQMFLRVALQGKTIVGALLGGLSGVEVTKKLIGVRRSTGDSFVFPVILGMMIGRVGCFLTGLSDRTYGVATTLPWGVDFGDGILRHPTQLYEVAFLFLLFWGLLYWGAKQGGDREPKGEPKGQRHRMRQDGDLFRVFMMAYLGFRLVIDFIKPEFRPVLGLSAIQIACVGGLLYYRKDLLRLMPKATR